VRRTSSSFRAESRLRRPAAPPVRALVRIFATALRAWWDDDALRLGASLAYYTLFAIAPVLLVATGIAGLVFNTDAVRGEIVDQLDRLVGREGARAVQSLLDGASQRRAGIVATTIGSVAFVIAATGAFLELQAALNTVWRVKSNPGAHLKAFPARSSALLRPGGRDRFSAAGLARGDGGSCGIQRVALAPLLERPAGVERTAITRIAHWDHIAVRAPLPHPA